MTDTQHKSLDHTHHVYNHPRTAYRFSRRSFLVAGAALCVAGCGLAPATQNPSLPTSTPYRPPQPMTPANVAQLTQLATLENGSLTIRSVAWDQMGGRWRLASRAMCISGMCRRIAGRERSPALIARSTTSPGRMTVRNSSPPASRGRYDCGMCKYGGRLLKLRDTHRPSLPCPGRRISARLRRAAATARSKSGMERAARIWRVGMDPPHMRPRFKDGIR